MLALGKILTCDHKLCPACICTCLRAVLWIWSSDWSRLL